MLTASTKIERQRDEERNEKDEEEHLQDLSLLL